MKLSKYLTEKNLLIVTFAITLIALFLDRVFMFGGYIVELWDNAVNYYSIAFVIFFIFIVSNIIIIFLSFFRVSKRDNEKVKIIFISDWTRIILKSFVIFFLIVHFNQRLFREFMVLSGLYLLLPSYEGLLSGPLLSAILILAILIYLAWKKPIDNIVCLNCGIKFSVGQKFCKKCGNKL